MSKNKALWKIPNDSFSKLIVWFKDGNVRTFYSLDWKHPKAKKRSKSLGINRLKRLVSSYGKNAGVAQIYDIASNALVQNFYEGVPTRKKS
ncbi:hypothetical protein [Aquimarina rhabdastrellae]